ncbi:MAG: orotidine-5'-phosphate decarboxylase [Halothermotrichaceae bacterium]
MRVKEKLITALDTSKEKRLIELVNNLEQNVEVFKIGLEQYLASRGKALDLLKEKNKKIFLDLKFHDIPNTMAAAARNAVREGVWMMNIHITGKEAMKWVMEAVTDEAAKLGVDRPLVIGVTVLTSLDDKDLNDLGINVTTEELVIKRAALAKSAGLDGVVSSPREAAKIKKACGNEFITVCPGIRPEWSVKGDQKRIMPPAKALEVGADYLVVGRPIRTADNPAQAADKIIKEMEEVK